MTPFEELKRYVGFDEADSQRLRALWPIVEPHLDRIIRRFYERILDNPHARDVLGNEAQVERLMVTLRRWLTELLQGPHDEAYYERRTRIGHVHVQVRLPSRFMSMAMSGIRTDLVEIISAESPDPAPALAALDRISSIDLAIMTGTFIERRETEELTTLSEIIVSNLPVTVLLVGSDDRIVAATRPGARLFGVRNVLGQPWNTAIPEPLLSAAHLDTQVPYALESGREIVMLRIDAPIDGRNRSFRISVVPLDHPLAKLLLHFEELTEAVDTEARLRRTETLAKLGEMSAAVAHELRNPLAGMSGALQRIHHTLPEEDRRKQIMEKVLQQIGRLDALVTDLLAFARPYPAQLAPIDLRDAVVQALEHVANRDHVTVEVLGAGVAPANASLLQQILINLAQNSAQALVPNGTLRFEVRDNVLYVADDGPGIPEENRARIFEPFFTTRTRGTGLGLAVSQKAAAAMGATLRLLDQGPLRGACFEIVFTGRTLTFDTAARTG